MSKPTVNVRFGEAAHRLDQDLQSTHGWHIAGPRFTLTPIDKWQPDAVSFAEAVRRANEKTLYGLWLEPVPRRSPRISVTGFLVTPREGGNAHSAFPLGDLPHDVARPLTETWVARGCELAAILHHIEMPRGLPAFALTPLAKA